jgi:DNA-binding CsgD family transcriptional regulator
MLDWRTSPARPPEGAPPPLGGEARSARGALVSRTAADLLGGEVLDELDYPLLLVSSTLALLWRNRAAAQLPVGALPIHLQDERLVADTVADHGPLRRAVVAAVHQGRRSLLTLSAGEPGEADIAVVPLGSAPAADAALLICPKPHVCPALTLDCYARRRKLTSGETRVLRGLCNGLAPDDIARDHGVAVSTVRTQIGSLRAKTGAKDLRALALKLATLPPLVTALGIGTWPARP